MNGQPVLGSRCTVVVAAAGYGKTTAVQRWLGPRAVAWRSTPDLAGPAPATDWLVLVDLCGTPDGLTAAIALGYPLYFACRRRAALDTLPAFLGELVVLLPVAAVVLAQPHAGSALAGHPDRLGSVLLLAALGSVAFVLYLGASSRLPFGVFGLLTYLEPALLVVVSTTALGEPLQAGDALTFGPIAVALLLLAATRLVPPRRGRWAVRAG